VGARLKEARAERGVSLDDAARETRIKPRFLEALEGDAPPSAFRAPVYARAFLREYARYLRLDPESLVGAYAEAHVEARPAPIELPHPPTRRRSRVLGWVLVLLAVGALATLAVVAALDPEAPGPATPSEAERGIGRPPAGPDQVVLRLRIAERGTWLSVSVDGKVGARGRQPRGWTRTFRGDRRIRIEVADAGAVRLRLNGERLGRPAKDGITYRAEYLLRGGRIEIEEPQA
jgi:transcriptional regulator with XRE-family HTH domain